MQSNQILSRPSENLFSWPLFVKVQIGKLSEILARATISIELRNGKLKDGVIA